MNTLEVYQTNRDYDLFYFKRSVENRNFIKSLFKHKIQLKILRDKVLIYEKSLDKMIEVAKDFYNTVEIVETIEDGKPPKKPDNNSNNNEDEQEWLKLFQYMDTHSLSDLKKSLSRRYHPDTCKDDSSKNMGTINGLIDNLIKWSDS